MDIKSLWNKFLELRKSPACIILSIIGLLDIFVLFLILIITISRILNIASIDLINNILAIFYFLLIISFMIVRIPGFPYYMAIIIGLFIIEKLFKIELKNNFAKNNKKYTITWIVCFFTAIIFSFVWKPLFEWINHLL